MMNPFMAKESEKLRNTAVLMPSSFTCPSGRCEPFRNVCCDDQKLNVIQ